MEKNNKHSILKLLLSGMALVAGIGLCYILITTFQIEMVIVFTSLLIAGIVLYMIVQFRKTLTKRDNCMLAICDILMEEFIGTASNESVNK